MCPVCVRDHGMGVSVDDPVDLFSYPAIETFVHVVRRDLEPFGDLTAEQ